jgi:hypothetical protein
MVNLLSNNFRLKGALLQLFFFFDDEGWLLLFCRSLNFWWIIFDFLDDFLGVLIDLRCKSHSLLHLKQVFLISLLFFCTAIIEKVLFSYLLYLRFVIESLSWRFELYAIYSFDSLGASHRTFVLIIFFDVFDLLLAVRF